MEKVKEIIIVQGAEETHLGNIGGVGHAILLGEILIEKCHVKGQALVTPLDTRRAGVPLYVGQLGYTLVVLPGPGHLVGAKFLQVEERAVKAALSLIAADISLPSGAALSRHRQASVLLGQELHGVIGGIGLRVYGRYVQIVCTRHHAQGQDACQNRLYHCLFHIRIDCLGIRN